MAKEKAGFWFTGLVVLLVANEKGGFCAGPAKLPLADLANEANEKGEAFGVEGDPEKGLEIAAAS